MIPGVEIGNGHGYGLCAILSDFIHYPMSPPSRDSVFLPLFSAVLYNPDDLKVLLYLFPK